MIRAAALFLVLALATPVFAQVDTTLFLSISPQYPKPHEPVFVTVQSPLLDVSDRVITWRSGGTIVLEGEGETTARILAPGSGEQTRLTVSIGGLDETASITIAPASVDLIWEADSYTPGLYRGRHLPSPGATITLQALPHLTKGGAEIPASQLSYTWRRNGSILSAASGRGQSSTSFVLGTFTDSETITVQVTSADKTIVAEGRATIVPEEPVVHLYIEHPLYGILYNNALLDATNISDTEMAFAAIPYHVRALGPKDPKFSYTWRVNRQDIEESSERPHVLTINAGPSGGEALIELSVTHKDSYLFDGRGGWTVTFGSFLSESTTNKESVF